MTRKPMIQIAVGQTWRPTNGEAQREVEEHYAARIADKHPLGTILVLWQGPHSGAWGRCTERSFRQWVARTKATLLRDVAA